MNEPHEPVYNNEPQKGEQLSERLAYYGGPLRTSLKRLEHHSIMISRGVSIVPSASCGPN